MTGWYWNTFCYRTSLVAVSDRFMFPACNFIKKETREVTFICKFCKIFKNIFWQNTSGWLFLVFICKFWEVFQNTSLWRTYEKLLFHLQVAVWTITYRKNYSPSAFQAFYTRRSSYSKALMYLKSLKIICKEANL